MREEGDSNEVGRVDRPRRGSVHHTGSDYRRLCDEGEHRERRHRFLVGQSSGRRQRH